MSLRSNGPKPTRRQILAGGAALGAMPVVRGAAQLAMRPRVILELVRRGGAMRAVERVIWVAR